MSSPLPDRYVVGAYAASPTHQRWQPGLEQEYLHAVAALPRVAALELPWIDGLHPHDDEWLLKHLPPGIDIVLTDIPGTVKRCTVNPSFGLASRDPEGRALALQTLARVNEDAHRLNDRTGRRAVQTVELHSAPRAHHGSTDALAQSLDLLADWDWDGATLVIEHCDADVAEQEPEKGYLTLNDEIEAILRSGTDVGLSINWGRSAIELRDPDRVREHVITAAAAGLLRGLMISGASDQDGPFGPAWIDAHHPFKQSTHHPYGDPQSLLTEERLASTLAAAGPISWAGVKLGWAAGDSPVEHRVQMIAHALDALDRNSPSLSTSRTIGQ
jgi:hypothetical protein